MLILISALGRKPLVSVLRLLYFTVAADIEGIIILKRNSVVCLSLESVQNHINPDVASSEHRNRTLYTAHASHS